MTGNLRKPLLICQIALMVGAAILLQHCALISSRSSAPPPASRPITAEATVSPDEVNVPIDRSHPNQKLMNDQVLLSHARQPLIVHFQHNREKVPSMPEIEEIQTLSAARVRCHQLMAKKIYQLPLERRLTLGPVLLDQSPELKLQLETVIIEKGNLEVLWNADRTKVEGRYILPGQLIVGPIMQHLQSSMGDTESPAPATEFREISTEQRQRLARDRAIELARLNLREKMEASPVRSNQTMGELIKRDPRLQNRLENFVRSAPLKSESINPDGSVTVVIEADAGRLMDLLMR